MNGTMKMITDRERIEFLVVDDGRFQVHSRIGHAFIWCQKDADIYATGTDWEEALDNAIRRYRSEH